MRPARQGSAPPLDGPGGWSDASDWAIDPWCPWTWRDFVEAVVPDGATSTGPGGPA